MPAEVTRSEIAAAAARVSPHIRLTPVIELGEVFGRGYRVSLKLEHLQVTGSFKPRGALSLLTTAQVPDAGVAAASGGNFGIAVAYACSRLGHDATIFVPESSPVEKIGRIAEYGAEVHVIPGYYDQALAEATRYIAEHGALEAHAFDQHEVVVGQGTVAREIVEQVSDATSVVVAVGGGGLIAGVAGWFRDDADVIAVEPRLCASFHAALANGGPVEVEVGGVAASSLGSAMIGAHAWEASRWVDRSILVEDEDILGAQAWLWAHCRLVVEPAAATTLAAIMTGAVEEEMGGHVVVLLSGGNVDPASVS